MANSPAGDSLRRLAVRFAAGADRVRRKSYLACWEVLVPATPVDTGRARNNWYPSIGAPSADVQMTGSFDRSGREAIARADDVMASLQAEDESVLYITNNLPYIRRLNEGWSAQAPAGFVEQGVRAAVEAIGAAAVFSEE